jgi:uncharacterized RDD family membrane protein YckC
VDVQGAPEGVGRSAALYTPEAVRVDLPLADVGTRALAALLDLMLLLSLVYIVLLLGLAAGGFLAVAGGGDGAAWVFVAALVLYFLVLWGYPTGSEVLFRGRTAGKAALGLRVVTVDGAPIRFRHAAIRGLFAFVDFYLLLGIPALVTALCTRRGQRLGDLAAGTVVIRDRAAGAAADQPVRFAVPPALASYAATLDVRGLAPADYAVVRRFLLRASTLRPEHRARVAADLANALAELMGHVPPPGTHPEALILCTAALVQAQGAPVPGPTPAPL